MAAQSSGVEPYWNTVRQIAAFGAVLTVSLMIGGAAVIGIWLGIRQLISRSHPA